MHKIIILLFFIIHHFTWSQNNHLKSTIIPVPKQVNVHKNIIYTKYGTANILLDLYLPKCKTKTPTIVLVHGGGWAFGDKKGFQSLAVSFAEKGFAVANINYRLSHQEKFPGSVEDTKTAIRWVRAHADQYNLDANHIFGVGGSAGGHLIAMAGLTSEKEFKGNRDFLTYTSQLKAIVIMGAGVDQYKRILNAKNNYIKNCEIYLGNFKTNPDIYIQASPITHLSKNDPPILMIDGSLDKPGARYVDFTKKMDSLKIPHQFEIVPNAKHGQWSTEPFRSIYVDKITTYLNHLKN